MTDSTIPDVAPLGELVAYQPGSVVSRVVHKTGGGSMTVFAFAEGEGLSEHTSPFDAVVVLLDGEAEIRVGEDDRRVRAGDVTTLPAGVPHALHAARAFKMLLVMLRDPGSA